MRCEKKIRMRGGGRPIVAAVLLAIAGVILCCLAAGCTVFSAADREVVDHRAAVMRALADRLNAAAEPWDKLTLAYIIECEARAAANLSDAAHWRAPTFTHAPTFPAALPWAPVDAVDENPGAAAGGGDAPGEPSPEGGDSP